MISVLLIVDHFPFLETSSSDVRLLAPCHRRCATHLLVATTAHARGCPVSLCPIDYPLMPFFLVVNKGLEKLAVAPL